MPVQFAITTLNWLDSYGSLSSSFVCRKKLSLRYGCNLVNVSNTSSLVPSLRISRGVEHAVVPRQGQRQDEPGHELLAVPHPLHLAFRHAEDRHFGRVDDRREVRAADAAQG